MVSWSHNFGQVVSPFQLGGFTKALGDLTKVVRCPYSSDEVNVSYDLVNIKELVIDANSP